MKKLIALITTILTAATLGGTAVAYAEESGGGQTAYPEFVSRLDTGSADCFAADGDTFAIAEGRLLYVYSGGTLSEEDGAYVYKGGTIEHSAQGTVSAYEHRTAISDLYYGADGVLLLLDGDGQVYEYSGGTASLSDLTFPEEGGDAESGSLIFRIIDGELRAQDFENAPLVLNDGTYSSLKQYGQNIYVLRDGQLCAVEGTEIGSVTVTPIHFEYADYTHAERIAVGECAELLKSMSDARYVTVPAGQFVTRIDLSDVSGTYFSVSEKDGVHTFALAESMTALVLCTSGNADIIAADGEAYITESITSKNDWTQTRAPFDGAQLTIASGLYSSPYMCGATEIEELPAGTTVRVLYEVVSTVQDGGQVLETNFCRVSYDSGNGETEGYVATGFLTEYQFVTPSDDDAEGTWNDDYSEDNVVLTVVLVIVIVVLVIAGVAYLAYFSGSNRRKEKEKNKSDDQK